MVAIDMEMPKSCAECLFMSYSECLLNDEYIMDTAERDNDCPLKEIVTCKDCKHRDKVHPSLLSNKKDEVYFCTLQSDEYCYEVEDDFYCADGERRE